MPPDLRSPASNSSGSRSVWPQPGATLDWKPVLNNAASVAGNWVNEATGVVSLAAPTKDDNIVFNNLANGANCYWNIAPLLNSVKITPDYKPVGANAGTQAQITLGLSLIARGGFQDDSGGDTINSLPTGHLYLIPDQGKTLTATWTGTSTVSAPVTFGAGVTMSMSGGNKTFSSSLLIGGQVNWSSGDLTVSQLTVDSTGVFNVKGDLNLNAAPGAGAAVSFTNYGTFQKSAGNGTLKVAPGFGNAGSFIVGSGTVAFAGLAQQPGDNRVPGAVTVAPKTTLPKGTTLKAATYEVFAGDVLADKATLDGNLKLTSGHLWVMGANATPSEFKVTQELVFTGDSRLGVVLSSTGYSVVTATTVTFAGPANNPNQKVGWVEIKIDTIDAPTTGRYDIVQWTKVNGSGFATVSSDALT